MMKNFFNFTLFLLFTNILYSQKCDDLNEGVFEGHFGGFKFDMEKHGNFQLERMAEFGVIYLNKTEKISECENLLKRYKVVEKGQLPEPDRHEVMKVVVYKIEDGKLFYKINFVGTDVTLDGYFIKKSNKISEDFKKILEKE